MFCLMWFLERKGEHDVKTHMHLVPEIQVGDVRVSVMVLDA